MYSVKVVFLLSILALFYSCRKPEPLDIKMPQQKDAPVISATITDAEGVVVSAGYSMESIRNISDRNGHGKIPRDILVDSGMVRISEGNGATHNLYRLSPGVYGSNELELKDGSSYTLHVTDPKKGTTATATTTYYVQPQGSSVTPVYKGIRNGDTLCTLQVAIPDAQKDAKYFIGYTTTKQLRENVKVMSGPAGQNMSAMATFEPKQLELLQSNASTALNHSFTIKASAGDTLVVQIGRVDGGYYKYLQAYKRTGYLINQLTGEPINLPTNVQTGYGYFALCKPNRYVFDMKEYIR